MKRFSLLIILSVMAICAFADSFSITPKEKQQITEEAENWIDDMPEGLQDRLSDAVSHAMRGFFNEIEYFRNFADTAGIGNYKVSVKNLQGGNNGNIPMRVYKGLKKSNVKLPLLVYFHGGGCSLVSLDTSERFCRALAAEGNVIVVSVAYPLAPEYPFPSALNMCVAATEYICSKAESWGGDKMKISIGGDGAGGNLALSVYSKLPSTARIKSLVVFYPLLKTNGQLDPNDKRLYGRGYGFDSRLWEAFILAYNEGSKQEYKSLPPMLMISAGRDIIISEEKQFSSQNKNITYIEFEGALHGFLTDGRQNTAFNKAVALTDIYLTR